MKRLPAVAAVALMVLGGVVAVRTARVRARQEAPAQPANISIDTPAAADRLAAAIRFKTISFDEPARRDPEAFDALDAYLATAFPDVTRVLSRETAGEAALLYTWRGLRADLPPVLLLAHLDVVPAGDGATGTWTHPPFDGVIDGGSIWGRGTLDDKGAALGLLESVSGLIRSGFVPTRTVYLAFGDNEEVDAPDSGAAAIAARLAGRGVRNARLLDEGGFILDTVAGVTRPVALVGVTEKTAISLVLRVQSAGGHASMPPAETAVGILAGAIDRIERDPMPARIPAPVRDMFSTLAPYMGWPMRAAVTNLWLMRPLVLRQLSASPESNALIRTTMAPTMIEGSGKSNVLPTMARAVMNVRLAPGDTPDDVLTHVTRTVNDPRVSIGVERGAEAGGGQAPVASTGGGDFSALARSIRAVYPDAVVAPFITMGATDARRYRDVAANAYRLVPVEQAHAVDELHGIDEHIEIGAYERADPHVRDAHRAVGRERRIECRANHRWRGRGRPDGSHAQALRRDRRRRP